MQPALKARDNLVFCTDGAVLVNEHHLYASYAEYLKVVVDGDLKALEVCFGHLLEFLPFDVRVSVDQGALYLVRDDVPVLMVVPGVESLGSAAGGETSARRSYELIAYKDEISKDTGWDLKVQTLGIYATPRELVSAVLTQMCEEALETALHYAYRPR